MGREQDRAEYEKALWERYNENPVKFGDFFGKLPTGDDLSPDISNKYEKDIAEFNAAYNTLIDTGNKFKSSAEFVEFLKRLEAMYNGFIDKCEKGVDGYIANNNPLYFRAKASTGNLATQLDNIDLTRPNPMNESAYLDISNLNDRLKATKSGFRGLFVRDTEKGVNMEKALAKVTELAEIRKEHTSDPSYGIAEYKKALEELQTAANEYVEYKKGNVSGSVATERFTVAQGIGEFLKGEMARVDAMMPKQETIDKEIDDELEALDEEVKREKAGIDQKKELTDDEVNKQYDEMDSEMNPEQEKEEYGKEVEDGLKELQDEIKKEEEVKTQVKEETKKEEPKPEIKSDPKPQVKRAPMPKVAVQPKPQKLGSVQPKPQVIKPALPKKQSGLTGQTKFVTNADNATNLKNIRGAKNYIRSVARGSKKLDQDSRKKLVSALRNVLAYELVSKSTLLAKNYSGKDFDKLKTLITEQESFKKMAGAIFNAKSENELTAVAETIQTRMINTENGNQKGLFTKEFVQGITKATREEIANRKAEREMGKTNTQEVSTASL